MCSWHDIHSCTEILCGRDEVGTALSDRNRTVLVGMENKTRKQGVK